MNSTTTEYPAVPGDELMESFLALATAVLVSTETGEVEAVQPPDAPDGDFVGRVIPGEHLDELFGRGWLVNATDEGDEAEARREGAVLAEQVAGAPAEAGAAQAPGVGRGGAAGDVRPQAALRTRTTGAARKSGTGSGRVRRNRRKRGVSFGRRT